MAKMFIAGESAGSSSGQTYDVINPATGEVVDSAPKGNESDARAAVDAAYAAFQAWSETAAESRAQLMLKGVELVKKELQDLAVLLTKEQGKPVGDAQREIEHFLHGMNFYAGLASKTPLTTLRIIEILNQAGLPKGVLNVVTGPGGVVGEELLKNPKVSRVAFTGESKTGKHIMEVAGSLMKRVTLELGGSDPMIACEDADVDKALTGASVGRFYNCGQACLAVKRLYVVESLYGQFVEKLIGKVQRL